MLVVPTALAQMTANLVRSYALSQFPSWRPFAYKFESRASAMSTDFFVDQPLGIHCRFSELEFEGPEAALGTIIHEQYEVKDSLTVSDLQENSKFTILGTQSKIAQALSPTRLVVYYLYQKGLTDAEDNRLLLATDSSTVPFATRHTRIDSLGFKLEDANDGTSKIEFFGCDPKYISDSIKGLKGIFSMEG